MRADAQNTQNVVANWHAAQPRRKAAFKVKTIMGGEEFEFKKWLVGSTPISEFSYTIISQGFARVRSGFLYVGIPVTSFNKSVHY